MLRAPRSTKYYQGRFVPKHPEKYVGDVNNIVFRSSWELKMMKWLDETPAILKYSSEELKIPYRSPKDGELHRYYPDFLIEYVTKDGEIKKALLEVKPEKETQPPKGGGRNYQQRAITYAVNQSKWKAATAFAKQNGMEFLVLTEHHLGIK